MTQSFDDISIRPAVPSDLADIRACVSAAYAPWRARLSAMPDVESGLDEDIARETVFVAHVGGALAGVAVLSLRESTAVLKNLAVDPARQGLGLGRRLVNRCLEAARAAGRRTLHLTTHRDMAEAQLFYAMQGFAEIKRDGHRVVMSKTL